jgi:hypothetical protein
MNPPGTTFICFSFISFIDVPPRTTHPRFLHDQPSSRRGGVRCAGNPLRPACAAPPVGGKGSCAAPRVLPRGLRCATGAATWPALRHGCRHVACAAPRVPPRGLRCATSPDCHSHQYKHVRRRTSPRAPNTHPSPEPEGSVSRIRVSRTATPPDGCAAAGPPCRRTATPPDHHAAGPPRRRPSAAGPQGRIAGPPPSGPPGGASRVTTGWASTAASDTGESTGRGPTRSGPGADQIRAGGRPDPGRGPTRSGPGADQIRMGCDRE